MSILTHLVNLLMRPAQQYVGHAFRISLDVFFAVVFTLVALGFLTATSYMILRDAYGPLLTGFILAATYAALALILMVVAIRMGRKTEHSELNSRQNDLLDEHVVNNLTATGLDREQARMISELLAANSLKPYELVGLALIAGFMTGRRKKET